jgi:hypothetical protein
MRWLWKSMDACTTVLNSCPVSNTVHILQSPFWGFWLLYEETGRAFPSLRPLQPNSSSAAAKLHPPQCLEKIKQYPLIENWGLGRLGGSTMRLNAGGIQDRGSLNVWINIASPLCLHVPPLRFISKFSPLTLFRACIIICHVRSKITTHISTLMLINHQRKQRRCKSEPFGVFMLRSWRIRPEPVIFSSELSSPITSSIDLLRSLQVHSLQFTVFQGFFNCYHSSTQHFGGTFSKCDHYWICNYPSWRSHIRSHKSPHQSTLMSQKFRTERLSIILGPPAIISLDLGLFTHYLMPAWKNSHHRTINLRTSISASG